VSACQRFHVGDRVHIVDDSRHHIAPDPTRVYTVRVVEHNPSQPKGGGFWYRMHELSAGYSFRDDWLQPAGPLEAMRQMALPL